MRSLFRHLQQFQSLAESEGVYEITAPNGAVWSLGDIKYLYDRAMQRPVKIVPLQMRAELVPVGYYIQHSGCWIPIVGNRLEKSKICLHLADGRRKKFPESDLPLASVLNPDQKRQLDYNKVNPCLPVRQQQAIELFLVWNMPEDEAAKLMGVSKTNPVGMYATSGLTRLLKLIDQGLLERFNDDDNKLLSVA